MVTIRPDPSRARSLIIARASRRAIYRTKAARERGIPSHPLPQPVCLAHYCIVMEAHDQ